MNKVLSDSETNPVIGFKIFTSQLLPVRLVLLASQLDETGIRSLEARYLHFKVKGLEEILSMSSRFVEAVQTSELKTIFDCFKHMSRLVDEQYS